MVSKLFQGNILGLTRVPLTLLLGGVLYGCSQSTDNALTIAVASNMQFAMIEIVDAFEQKTNQSCVMVVSSSGKLTAQISQGAPFDLLISADTLYPNELYQAGLTENRPAVYAYGKLVMWSAIEGLEPSINQLISQKVKHVALANPKTAPYGVTTIQVLEGYGILDSIQHKLVYGESISQTNQFILSGAAEIGFTTKAVVLSPKMKEVGSWAELDPGTYSPIAQAVVIVRNENSKLSNQFFNFLFSPEAKEILQKFGYEIPD